MGLDMYFTAKKYVGGWNHQKGTEEYDLYSELTKKLDMEKYICEGSPSLTISFSVAYWRKANQIHNWFVNNVQDGEDCCQTSYVSKEDIQNLIHDCEAVLNNHSLAEAVLPSSSGFFFGGTDYNEDYYLDLEDTIKQLKPLLDLKDYGFYYHASW